jgi:hypothetical protein
MPVKFFTTFTPSHRCMFDEFFLPSYKKANKNKDFALYVSEMEQISPDGHYGTHGFRESTADKLRALIKFIEENKNEQIIYSDPDVQFFDGFTEDVLTYIDKDSDVDVWCQNDTPKCPENVILCTGFMILKCNDKLKTIFENSLKHVYNFEHDQYAFNYFRKDLNWKTLPEDKYYTIAYNTGNAVWKGEKYDNIPKNILMHHANWVAGIENKKLLLEYIKGELSRDIIS